MKKAILKFGFRIFEDIDNPIDFKNGDEVEVLRENACHNKEGAPVSIIFHHGLNEATTVAKHYLEFIDSEEED